MDKDFRKAVKQIQKLQIESAEKGHTMHVILRKLKSTLHLDATLFSEDSEVILSVKEFQYDGQKAIERINEFTDQVRILLTIDRESLIKKYPNLVP